jgi:Kef-type K+ transport system membrane component KefB
MPFFEITLPLKNPVLIFTLILFIILFAPIIFNKLRVPHLIGLIIAGAIIGPHGLNFMLRDSSIILFGTVGLLYIMFIAGIEIDLAEFVKNSGRSVVFGIYTFIVPMIIGTTAALYLLNFPVPTSVLLASLFASHTLIAYPIISKFGITKNRAVNVAVGGTLITDTAALLVLAVIAGMSTGEIDNNFWVLLSIKIIVFGLIVMLVFPVISRWFFKRFDDNVSQYIFVLGMVFLAAFLAETAGIEAIIGAFLAGLALNRLVPHTSPLMNRIEFVGNALFIPFFLIGVGMLVDYQAFFKDRETIIVAVTMTVIATLGKYIAAWLAQKTFGYTIDERRIIFGLSNAQAAATLAAVLVGYNIILDVNEMGEPVRLLNDAILNGSILMILITCTIASFATQRGAQKIALAETSAAGTEDFEREERILIPVNNIETTDELINLSVTVKSKKNKRGLYALNVIYNSSTDSDADKKGRKLLDKAAVAAASTDNYLHELLRYDLNIVNGITSVVKEQRITDLIVGLHQKKGITDTFLGTLTEGILTKCNTTTLIYKPTQPLATINRHLIIVPDRAEKEIGFPFWLIKVWNIGRNTGDKLVFYAPDLTLKYIKEVHLKHPVNAEFHSFSKDWDDFLILTREVKSDDNLIVVLSRKERPSWNSSMVKIPSYLNRYFSENNFTLIYPMQSGVNDNKDIDFNDNVFEPLKDNIEKLDDISRTLASLFKKK